MVTLGLGIFLWCCFLFLKLWPETFFVGDICPNLDVTFLPKSLSWYCQIFGLFCYFTAVGLTRFFVLCFFVLE